VKNDVCFYFAYGYNINDRLFKKRIGEKGKSDLKFPIDLGTYLLKNYRFGYFVDQKSETVGNIRYAARHHVLGVLYLITVDQLKKLDKSEEVPRIYQRKRLEVNQPFFAGPGIKAWIDLKPKILTPHPNPEKSYVKEIVDAAKKRGFPKDYINKYLTS
jgi:hypothetical protein